MHFKTLSVRNSDNIIYKTQKPPYKNQNLESTDLRQIQRLIQSSSISTALVPHSFRFFQVHWLYNRNIILVISTVPIEIMLLSLEKNTHTHTQRTKQAKTATTYNSPCLHHRWRCYQAIALNDQQTGPTSLALLPP